MDVVHLFEQRAIVVRFVDKPIAAVVVEVFLMS